MAAKALGQREKSSSGFGPAPSTKPDGKLHKNTKIYKKAHPYAVWISA
jgi:hypothetical protein